MIGIRIVHREAVGYRAIDSAAASQSASELPAQALANVAPNIYSVLHLIRPSPISFVFHCSQSNEKPTVCARETEQPLARILDKLHSAGWSSNTAQLRLLENCGT